MPYIVSMFIVLKLTAVMTVGRITYIVLVQT